MSIESRLASLEDTVLQGGEYVWRSRVQLVLSSCAVVASLGLASLAWVSPDYYNRGLIAAVAGPIAGIVFWLGLSTGVLMGLKVTQAGLTVRNPLRSVFLPWSALSQATVGTYGLRLETTTGSFPVFAAQSSNASSALPEAQRPVNRLADAINRLHINLDDSMGASKLPGRNESPVQRWIVPKTALLAFLAYTAATYLRVYVMG